METTELFLIGLNASYWFRECLVICTTCTSFVKNIAADFPAFLFLREVIESVCFGLVNSL